MIFFRSLRGQAVALLAFVTVLFLPFIGRAYFVDDYYFVTMARGILEHPTRPYDFRSDDAGKDNIAWERGQPPRMVNPPLFHYYLAAVMHICGDDRSWVLRLSMLPFAWVSVLSMFILGRHFVRDSFGATALFAVTPVFWLTSYSLLIDSMLIAWLLAALVVFFRACEKKSIAWSLLSGVLMGAAILTKYFGVIVIALAFLWLVLDADRRRWWGAYASFPVCLSLLAAWSIWNIQTYGETHLLASMARGVKADQSLIFYLNKIISVASFLGGGSVFLLAGFPLLWKQSRVVFAGLLAVLAGFVWLFQSAAGGFSVSISVQLGLWIGATFAFVALLILKPLHDHRWFLTGWVLLGLLELIVVMPWVAGRYMLCILPALCWLVWGELETRAWHGFRKGILATTGVIGLLVAWGDQSQANTIYTLASQVESRLPVSAASRRYYLGDTFSGFRAYLQDMKWEAAFPDQSFQKGDVLLFARYRLSAWWRLPDSAYWERVGSIVFQNSCPVRVMSIPSSAGWYASVWGALPYVFVREPLEDYRLLRLGQGQS